MVFSQASTKPPLRPANANGAKPVARPTKESHGSKKPVHPTKSHGAKAAAAGQPPIRRLPVRPTLPQPVPRTPVARPSRLLPDPSDRHYSPTPTKPNSNSPTKPSLSPPSSQSPSGMRRLAHTATLEPVCSGRAHTLAIDKAMVVNFNSITNWDSNCFTRPSLLVAEKLKPATCLALPCLTPETCAEITADAERVAEANGGWKSRAVGCCTKDVLVSSLSNSVQRRIQAAFEQVVMPAALEHFPKANVKPRSLPSEANHFFIIKYTAEGKNASFGLHVDHTAVTVNIALSDDFDGGGTFVRASSKAAPTEAGRSSQVSK